MTPRTPRDTLAASRSGSPTASSLTTANPCSAGAGVTILSPTTYSCTALPLPQSELPCAPVASIPPRVRPYQYGECGSARPASPATLTRSRSSMPLSTVRRRLALSTATPLRADDGAVAAAGARQLREALRLVATLTLRRAAAAAATATTSSCSVLGNVAFSARQTVRSGNEPYALVTVQSDVPHVHDTGSGGGLAPARLRRTRARNTTRMACVTCIATTIRTQKCALAI
ncbi:LOW QUALITY PROTEIN: hypothetical protein U9M48_041190 [Paspalum notatum var. saurae]|uniref:Uncharacterized protein n=1 Tax=Paspalum notatum var. saurae TaxID=547442 RepID=A0AAQ3US55_PASNO